MTIIDIFCLVCLVFIVFRVEYYFARLETKKVGEEYKQSRADKHFLELTRTELEAIPLDPNKQK